MELQGNLFRDDGRGDGLELLGEQKDIRYYAGHPRSILNGPATTGMGFWSINPYVGCAFGCAYCYARYAHRYAMERAAAKDVMDEALARDFAGMTPWLAFERHIFVKDTAPAVLRETLRDGSAKPPALTLAEPAATG